MKLRNSRFGRSIRTSSRPQSPPRATACAEPLESRLVLAAGDLDLTFGTSGLAQIQTVSNVPAALVLQTDGKTVVGGTHVVPGHAPEAFLERYLTDGRLDPSFGTAGLALIDASP